MNIKPFPSTDAAYEAVVTVQNAVWSDEPTSVEELKYSDQNRDKNYCYQRLVVDVEDQLVATGVYCESARSYRPGKYRIDIDVHPDWERRGIGTALYTYILNAVHGREPKPILLTCDSREDKVQGIQFLQNRGFEQVMRWPTSRLELASFDGSRFVGRIEKMEASGIEIRTVAELLKTDPNCQQKLYDLDWAGSQDEPSPDIPTPLPFEQFVRSYFDTPTYLPEGWFVAVDNGVYVGMSELKKVPTTTEWLDTGFTCVLRTHRRRGVATSLKLRAIEFAKRYGAKALKTGNEENNPMYQINLNLGFTPEPAWLAFEKKLERD